MSCILNIIGESLDIDTFLTRSQLHAYKKTYRGQPRFKSQPDGERMSYSAVSFKVSEAPFADFKKQIEDAMIFLKGNEAKLKYIAETKAIQYAQLDFGIENTEAFSQSAILPNELLKLAGDLGLAIEISLYS